MKEQMNNLWMERDTKMNKKYATFENFIEVGKVGSRHQER